MKSGHSGLLWIQVPGVAALSLRHMLRAVFCHREDREELPDRSGALQRLIGPECVLAGYFQEPVARRFPDLWKDRDVMRITSVGEPATVQAAVYQHLVGQDPSLKEKRPRVFGSLVDFLDSRREPVTSGLGAATGRRFAAAGVFDAVIVEEDESSLREFVVALSRRFESQMSDSREHVLLAGLVAYPGSLVEAFGGGRAGAALPDDLRSRYRRRNPRDAAFHENAKRQTVRAHRASIFPRRTRSLGTSTDPVFVFNHLPKSSGTSVRAWLQSAFGSVEDHTEFASRSNPVRRHPVRLDRLAADTVLCGHFCDGDFRLRDRYPEIWRQGSRFHPFTFLRDPLAAAISDFHHTRRTKSDPPADGELEEFLLAQRNPLAFRLGCDESDWRDVIGRHFFVGIVERLATERPRLLHAMREILERAPTSATVERALAAIHRLDSTEFPRINVGGKGAPTVPEEILQTFRERNALDYRIYHHALETLGADRP